MMLLQHTAGTWNKYTNLECCAKLVRLLKMSMETESTVRVATEAKMELHTIRTSLEASLSA
jgi:hypothetical protein